MKARIDFHIHSCLSPCASLAMAPRTIAGRARAAGLDCIALTDHGCTENLPAFQAACRETGIACLYGIEATSAEEVHLLGLFDRLDVAMEFGGMVYDAIADFPNDADRFGDQPIVNAREEILGCAEKLLIAATSIPFEELVERVLERGGLCIPSHIDREYSGAISHLGFLPDLPYSAVEVIGRRPPPSASKWPVVRFSDAHDPAQIARRFTEIDTASFSVPDLCRAFEALEEH
jgi:PHP family Zn ribbon phosphoesterase